jgi:hypothetical protein
MLSPNVDYIKIIPYDFHLPNSFIIERALQSNYIKKMYHNPLFFKNYLMNNMSKYSFHFTKKTKTSYDIDMIATKKTFFYIQQFLHT